MITISLSDERAQETLEELMRLLRHSHGPSVLTLIHDIQMAQNAEQMRKLRREVD